MSGFNVRAGDGAARQTDSENEGVDLRYCNIICNLIDDAKAAPDRYARCAELLLAEILGIRRGPRRNSVHPSTGRSPALYGDRGNCLSLQKPIRVLRDSVVIYRASSNPLRRFRDDASEVRNGMSCGGVKNYHRRQGG